MDETSLFEGIEPADAKRAEKMSATILERSSGTTYATELALSVLVRVVQQKMGAENARAWAKEQLVHTILDHFDEYEFKMRRSKDY